MGCCGKGCEGGQGTPAVREYRTKAHALRMRPGFDTARLNQLVDELETDVYREREGRRRT